MLSDDVLAAVQSSAALLKAHGLTATATLLSRTNPSVYTPGQTVTQTETSHSVDAVVTSYDEKEIDGDRVQATDVKVILVAPPVTPKVNDVMVVDGVRRRVVMPKLIMIGSQLAAAELQLRGP